MKQKYILLILLVIIISTTSLSVLAVTPNIELTPPTQSVNQSTQATIEVVVEDVIDLKGANIILNFDASKLQYNSSVDGGFIPGALLAPPIIDNTNGSVTLDIAGIFYASGTGTIMTVTFDTIGAGDGSITFGITTLRDKDNLIIDHSTTDGCVITVNAELTEIVVLSEIMGLFVGENRTIISITASYNYGPDKTIALANCSYDSDDESVATIAVGEITAMGAGTATITVTYSEGVITKTDTLMVTVNPIQLTSIVVLPETMNLLKGDSETIISVTAHYNNGDTASIALANCTYNSNATAVATVSTSGEITAIDVGTATITVTYSEGVITKTDIIEITVIPVPNLKLIPPSQSVITGNPVVINILVENVTNLKGVSITLNFDASKLQYVSSADGGFIPGAFLPAPTVDNTNGTVILNLASLTSSVSGTGTIITITFNTIEAGDTTITFGTTTLRDKDNYDIDHTAGDGCMITVNPIQLTSIVVLPETMTLFEGGETDSIASITAYYNNGDTAIVTLGDCTYSSDDESVATVTVGVVTTVDPGTATITVTYIEGGITKTDIIEITVIPVPNLKLTPPSQSVGVSDFGTINVIVEDATDLRGANISLNFDASKLQYSSSSNGNFIPNDTLQVISIDNTNGSVTLDIAGLGLSGYHSGTGTGTIIIVVFERIATSSTNITFGTTQLRDKDNNTINHTAGSGCLFTNLLGDFGGPNGSPDCIVDFEDLMIFALAYGSTPSDDNWNPVCDIASPSSPAPDGVIDFEDLMVFAMHYGDTCEDL